MAAVLKLLLLLLFVFSLSYLFGLYSNTKSLLNFTKKSILSYKPNCTTHIPNNSQKNITTSLLSPDDFETHHSLPLSTDQDQLQASSLQPFPYCDMSYRDYCPCQDPTREKSFSTGQLLFHRERHCPSDHELSLRCLIPNPPKYKRTFSWPTSREWAWFDNVPSKTLTVSKKDQNWVRVFGPKLYFPGGGTSFPKGAKDYVKKMEKLVPLRSGSVRTVLDIGCGVASFGAQLMDLNILTMSIAPRDVHHAQVQFALERGLPALLGVMSTYRLPFPARSFDMAHCSRCLIDWTFYGGRYLIEIDRLLRPGGYWVLSGPPIAWRTSYKGWEIQPEKLKQNQDNLELLARRLCWKKLAEKGILAVWRKPNNHEECLQSSKLLKSPPFCNGNDADNAWYTNMDDCITPLPKVKAKDDVAGGFLPKWPKRLNSVSPRIKRRSIQGVTPNAFNKDNQLWKKRVLHYGIFLSSISRGGYRNIMDMSAGLGGFAAALSNTSSWVMNVVPSDMVNNTLGVIYERGLIGTYMNWCEAFSTYPRTYDLIHANGVFSIYLNKCDIVDILIEMDRILRPGGAVIVRDHVDVIVKVQEIANRMKWQSQIKHTEKGPYNSEKLLIVDNSPLVQHHQGY